MKISIITVCLNSVETIERTIKSVVEQDYEDIEYIIIDGKSTDGTVEVIKKYQDKLAYWCSETDMGLYDAMNKGLAVATGDIVGIINSDDWYEKNVFSHISHFFINYPQIDILCGNVNYIKNNELISTTRTTESPDDIQFKMIYNHQGIFAWKKVYDAIGDFDTSLKITADYDWLLKAYNAGCKFAQDYVVYANFTLGGVSSGNSLNTSYEMRKVALRHARGDLKIKKKIETYYNRTIPFLVFLTKAQECKLPKGKDYENIFRMDLREKKVYIWGTGEYGRIFAEIFEKFNINMLGFIDSNKKEDRIMGYPVFFPAEIGKDQQICIATSIYETEIREQAKQLGIPDKNVFSIFEI